MMSRLASVSVMLVAFLSLSPWISPTCAAQSGFYARHKAAVARNPPGVKLLLRTPDGRRSFHLFETIPFEMEYSSAQADTYSIELDESMNIGGWKHKFEIVPRNLVLLNASEFDQQTFSCCGSYRRFLSKQPRILHRELTDYFRFEKPGTYRLYLTTWCVFEFPGHPDDPRPSKTPVTSNILTLTILPDDPNWDARRLAETLQQLNDPAIRAKYDALKAAILNMRSETQQDVAMVNRLNQTELVRAQEALNALDSEAAIRERVKMMNMPTRKEVETDYKLGLLGTLLPQPLLASTTRPDLLVAAMEARAAEPDFAPDYGYVDRWAHYAVVRDHRELFRPLPDEKANQQRLALISKFEIVEKQRIVSRLQSLLPAKSGDAKRLTALAIQEVKADVAYQLRPKRRVQTNR